MIEKNEKIYVAVRAIPNELEIKDVYPCERKAEIERCANSRVRKEKYFAWELLKNTVEEKLHIPFDSLCFEKSSSGKWVSDKIFFSISHSDGVAAVAVAQKNVGVDIESVKRHREGIERQILTDAELCDLENIPDEEKAEQVIKLWTKKEAYFKLLDEKHFAPKKTETKDFISVTKSITLENSEYAVSVCADGLTDGDILWSILTRKEEK